MKNTLKIAALLAVTALFSGCVETTAPAPTPVSTPAPAVQHCWHNGQGDTVCN